MPTTKPNPGRIGALIRWAAAGCLCVILASPCRGDVAPESGLLAHVQEPSGGTWCPETPITHCTEIVRSTTASGQVEFLLFFMRGAYSWPGEALCLVSLHDELAWPDAWQLVEFDPCGDGWGSLSPAGPHHALDLEWMYGYPITSEPQGVVPVARLVMNVVGPGRLDLVAPYYQNDVVLRQDCPWGATFVTYPVQVYAEAGMQCGYIAAHCGYKYDACEAEFSVAELLLNAPLGGTAEGTVDFWAYYWGNFDMLCPLAVDTHASWCTAWIDPHYTLWNAQLHVTADATGLSPATYETAIELSNAQYGVSRCLPVEFTVEEFPVPAATASWGRIKARYR